MHHARTLPSKPAPAPHVCLQGRADAWAAPCCSDATSEEDELCTGAWKRVLFKQEVRFMQLRALFRESCFKGVGASRSCEDDQWLYDAGIRANGWNRFRIAIWFSRTLTLRTKIYSTPSNSKVMRPGMLAHPSCA